MACKSACHSQSLVAWSRGPLPSLSIPEGGPDSRRRFRSPTELPELEAVTARLQAEGVKVRIEPAHPGDRDRYRLITEQRWVERVRTSLEDINGQQA